MSIRPASIAIDLRSEGSAVANIAAHVAAYLKFRSLKLWAAFVAHQHFRADRHLQVFVSRRSGETLMLVGYTPPLIQTLRNPENYFSNRTRAK